MSGPARPWIQIASRTCYRKCRATPSGQSAWAQMFETLPRVTGKTRKFWVPCIQCALSTFRASATESCVILCGAWYFWGVMALSRRAYHLTAEQHRYRPRSGSRKRSSSGQRSGERFEFHTRPWRPRHVSNDLTLLLQASILLSLAWKDGLFELPDELTSSFPTRRERASASQASTSRSLSPYDAPFQCPVAVKRHVRTSRRRSPTVILVLISAP